MAATPTAELDPRYSSPEATPRPWEETRALIIRAEVFWLSTVHPEGHPHVTPLIGVRTSHVFEVVPRTVFAFGKGGPFSQSRYRFTARSPRP